jgi:hypothetical protein
MAYVSISKDLIGDVEHKIRNMKDKQINELDKVAATLTVPVSDPTALELIWGEHLHLQSVIPDKWCKTVDTIYIKTDIQEEDGTHFSASFNLNAQPPSKFRIPATESVGYGSGLTVRLPSDHPLLQESIAHTRQVRDINTHWRKIGSDVVSFLRSAKSLNEALKLWPALALYIPESYLKKVAEKKAKSETTQSKAQEFLAGIDTNTITAAAVASRMTTT